MIKLYDTKSLCPHCMKPVPASVIERENKILMTKACHEHGRQEALISSNAGWYHSIMKFAPQLHAPVAGKKPVTAGCPMDCGYCVGHKQKMYLPVLPITSACNLNCPVCYTINKNHEPYFISKPEFQSILNSIRTIDPDMQIVNFTGGEPLMHPDFCGLVEMCHKEGVHRITVSTNGLKFLDDAELLPRLTELNARIVLSFNSFKPEPYIITSGQNLLEKKLRILELLGKYKPVTSLLTVVANGVNDDEIGGIVRHVLKSDFIVSSEIHTVTFTGQNVDKFDRNTRITTWDVINNIIRENPGTAVEDFLPSPCAHPLCYAVCYFLKLNNDTIFSFTKFIENKKVYELLSGSLYIEPNLKTEEILTEALNNLWSMEKPDSVSQSALDALNKLIRRLYPASKRDYMQQQSIAEQSTKAVYIHSHMDADTFDTERISQCSVAVPDGNGNYIPTCAYNNIYRARDWRFCEPVK